MSWLLPVLSLFRADPNLGAFTHVVQPADWTVDGWVQKMTVLKCYSLVSRTVSYWKEWGSEKYEVGAGIFLVLTRAPPQPAVIKNDRLSHGASFYSPQASLFPHQDGALIYSMPLSRALKNTLVDSAAEWQVPLFLLQLAEGCFG